MIVLVCGGREYQGDVTCLDLIDIDILIHGDAKGADRRAAQYIMSKGIHAAGVPALWKILGKKAGYERNAAMLLLKPNYCVAFPGGRGTSMMVELCEDAGITVWRPHGY
jgi:hypothetical protein